MTDWLRRYLTDEWAAMTDRQRRYLTVHTEEVGPAPAGTPHYHFHLGADGVVRASMEGVRVLQSWVDEAYENSRRQVRDLQNCGTLLHEWVEDFTRFHASSQDPEELWGSVRSYDSPSSQPDVKLWENPAHNPLDDIYAMLQRAYHGWPNGRGNARYVITHSRQVGKTLLYRRMVESYRVLRAQAMQRIQDTVPQRNYFRQFVAQHWVLLDPRTTRGVSIDASRRS